MLLCVFYRTESIYFIIGKKNGVWIHERAERMESEDVPVAVSIWKPNELPESLGQPERMEDEEDFRRLQEMYPIMARRLKPYVDEVCSLLEYPGSMMYDEYPDQLSLRKKSLEIWERAEKGERFGKDAPGWEQVQEFDRCTFAAGDDAPKKDQQETVYPGKSN